MTSRVVLQLHSLIGNVPIEQTVKPIMLYLRLLLLCLLVVAFVPAISTVLPHAFGYL